MNIAQWNTKSAEKSLFIYRRALPFWMGGIFCFVHIPRTQYSPDSACLILQGKTWSWNSKLTHPEIYVAFPPTHHQHRLVSILRWGIWRLVISTAGCGWKTWDTSTYNLLSIVGTPFLMIHQCTISFPRDNTLLSVYCISLYSHNQYSVKLQHLID